jgi:protein phosphatase 2C
MNIYFKSRLGKRRTNEDRHTIFLNYDNHDSNKTPIDLYGIYDGHGGYHVSSLLSEIMPKLFLDKHMTYPLNKRQINKICNGVQRIIVEKYPSKSMECGSTCLIAIKYKYNDEVLLNVINVGDSRAVICYGTTAFSITSDHKPLYPNEIQRITKQGGVVYCDGLDWRVDNLSLSRSFGDASSKFTPPIPDLFLHKLSKNDKFMVLACDGLWDVLDNQSVINFILYYCYDEKGNRKNKDLDIASKLTLYALSQGSMDNVTAIVVFFDN